MNPTMLRIPDLGVERLGSDGWHAMDRDDFVEIDGGSYLHVNHEGLTVGRIQGAGAMLIVCLVVLAVAAACNTLAAQVGFAVSDWNDTPGRTATEVCAALRQCARS